MMQIIRSLRQPIIRPIRCFQFCKQGGINTKKLIALKCNSSGQMSKRCFYVIFFDVRFRFEKKHTIIQCLNYGIASLLKPRSVPMVFFFGRTAEMIGVAIANFERKLRNRKVLARSNSLGEQWAVALIERSYHLAFEGSH